MPTLIVHGDDDQIVPIGASAMMSAEIVPGAVLKVYEGGDHGLPTTHQDALNADLLAFVRALNHDTVCNIWCYMKRDSRLSSVLHALLHMAERNDPMTSEQLSRCLGTNPVVVRRTMGFLRRAGIVSSDRGQAGGWRISSDLSEVTLRHLYAALDEPEVFAIGHRNDAPECLVEQSVNAALDETFAEAEVLLLRRMGQVTLADLAGDFARRHAVRRHQNKDQENDA